MKLYLNSRYLTPVIHNKENGRGLPEALKYKALRGI